jgi:hypothetical protein
MGRQGRRHGWDVVLQYIQNTPSCPSTHPKFPGTPGQYLVSRTRRKGLAADSLVRSQSSHSSQNTFNLAQPYAQTSPSFRAFSRVFAIRLGWNRARDTLNPKRNQELGDLNRGYNTARTNTGPAQHHILVSRPAGASHWIALPTRGSLSRAESREQRAESERASEASCSTKVPSTKYLSLCPGVPPYPRSLL